MLLNKETLPPAIESWLSKAAWASEDDHKQVLSGLMSLFIAQRQEQDAAWQEKLEQSRGAAEVFDGRDRTGGKVARGTPHHYAKLAEDLARRGDYKAACHQLVLAFGEWEETWLIASDVSPSTFPGLVREGLMADMQKTLDAIFQAMEDARSTPGVWVQVLILAQRARYAFEMVEREAMTGIAGTSKDR